MNNSYRGLIFTNHALQRLHEREISQGDAWVAFHNSDQSRYAATKGAWIYYKTINGRKIEVVAKKNDRNEWVVLSVWAKPTFGQEHKKTPWLWKLLRQIFFGDYR
jgi:hypothetical protein